MITSTASTPPSGGLVRLSFAVSMSSSVNCEKTHHRARSSLGGTMPSPHSPANVFVISVVSVARSKESLPRSLGADHLDSRANLAVRGGRIVVKAVAKYDLSHPCRRSQEGSR